MQQDYLITIIRELMKCLDDFPGRSVSEETWNKWVFQKQVAMKNTEVSLRETQLSEDEFISRYCRNSGFSAITAKEFMDKHNAVPCNCGENGCNGWQMQLKATE